MIVLNLIFLEVQFECDFFLKYLVKILVYRYTDSLYDSFLAGLEEPTTPDVLPDQNPDRVGRREAFF